MPLATELEIRRSYEDRATASVYVGQRFATELMRLLHDRQVGAINRIMRKQKLWRTLEVAPGPGRLTRHIVPAGRQLCLEFNEAMIEEGRRVCPGHVEWIRGNAFNLPFDADEFDFVYSFRFVRHFYRTDRHRLYAELRRVLKPAGYFMMDAVNERVSRPLREAKPEDYPIYDKLYRPDELRAELAAAGFEVVSLAPVQKCYRWQYRSQVFLGPRVNWANRLAIRALEKLPFREGLEWIVTCRRA